MRSLIFFEKELGASFKNDFVKLEQNDSGDSPLILES